MLAAPIDLEGVGVVRVSAAHTDLIMSSNILMPCNDFILYMFGCPRVFLLEEK